MALNREKIEHIEHRFADDEQPWKDYSHSRKWRKKQMNKYIRLQGKDIEEDEESHKKGRKPYRGWEY